MARLAVRHTIERLRDSTIDKGFTKWLRNITIPTIETSGKTVVFNTVRAHRNNPHLTTDLFIGHLLAHNGNRVYILLDDGALEHWDSLRLGRSAKSLLNPMRDRRKRRHLQRQVRRYADLFAIPGLEIIWYSDLLPATPDPTIDSVIEGYAETSTLRYFEQSQYDPGNTSQRDYYQLSIPNGQTSRAVARAAIENLNPDVFATSHGLYSTWGPAYRFAKQAGIPTRVYSIHPYRNNGLLVQDAPTGSIDHRKLEDYLTTATFGKAERSIAEHYINTRLSHQANDTKEYFSNLTKDDNQVLENCVAESDQYAFTFALFPNVVWDAIGSHIDTVFDSVVDWIANTARTIAQHPENRLIIRLHPSEATRLRGVVASFDLIAEACPEITDLPNVTIIKPDIAVNSYELLQQCADVALVFTGTLGAEAQLLGVPVVPAATGRFSSRFVHEIHDLDDYRRILENPEPIITEFRASKDEIVKYVLKYHYYINEELFLLNSLLRKTHRKIVEVDSLNDPATFDQSNMAKTLRAFISE